MESSISKEELFRSAPVGQAIAALAVPTIISQLITVIYNMADTFFIGQMGDPNQVAAATVMMPLFMLMTAISNLFGIGGASLFSRLLGEGNREKARRCAAFCIWTAMGVALLYGLAVLVLRQRLLPVLGADEIVLPYSSKYLLWTVVIGAVPTVLGPMLAHLIRAQGNARQASFGIVFGGVLNIILDPIFIFVLRLEIVGAAVATLISNTAAVLYFISFLRRNGADGVISLSPGYYTMGEQIPTEVLSVGLPSFLISTMACISNGVLNHIIAGYSNEAVAGMGIAKRVDLVAFAIAQGMTQGTLPLIGYNFSSGDQPRMTAVLRRLFISCLLISLTGMLLLYVSAAPITRCFINDASTIAYGKEFLRIICTSCPATMLTFFSLTVFQATGKRLPPIFLSLMRKGTIDVALMLWLNQAVGVNGVAWATPAAEYISLVVSTAMMVRYLKRISKSPITEQKARSLP